MPLLNFINDLVKLHKLTVELKMQSLESGDRLFLIFEFGELYESSLVSQSSK